MSLCASKYNWVGKLIVFSFIAEDQEVLYTSLIIVNYGIETNSGQTIGSSCFDSTYKSVLSTQTPQTESNLKQGCSGGLFTNNNIFININEESSFAPSAVAATSTTVSLLTTLLEQFTLVILFPNQISKFWNKIYS